MVTNHTYSDAGLIGGPAASVDPRIFRDDNRTRLDLIKSFGKDQLSVNSEYSSSYAGTGEADGVDGFAIINDDSSEVAVLLYKFYKQSGGQTAVDMVALTINSLPLSQGKVDSYHYRVDFTHSNVYTIWQQQNKPPKPTESQWAEMRAASKLEAFRPMAEITYDGGPYKESFMLPRQSVS
jgi:hypothetical protein